MDAVELREIVRSIRQHIEQGVASEAFLFDRNPSGGTGIYTYLKHRMDEISAMLSAAPTHTNEPIIGTAAPTQVETQELAKDLRRLYSLAAKISGSALLAGERCQAGDKEALYRIACEVLNGIGCVHSEITGDWPKLEDDAAPSTPPIEPRLQWCNECGEGFVNQCRSKVTPQNCPMLAIKSHD